MSAPTEFTINDLLYLMQRLRDPEGGCPWDIKQSYRSITSSTIEEAYEVVDAIEREDFDHLKEELGDLLFQVIFYSQLGKEDGHFQFPDIVDALTAKLIRRHPHVFPDGTLSSRAGGEAGYATDDEIKQRWEDLKAQERQQKGSSGLLDDVPRALPALSRAVKLQKRAANVGFDWPGVLPVIEKVKEEIAELEQALTEADDDSISDELGDVLFSVVNLTRHLKRDPERLLRQANGKFTKRFHFIEESLAREGISLEQADFGLLEILWNKAKQTV